MVARVKWLLPCFVAVGLATVIHSPARALGGAAASRDSGLSAHLVMVLSRQGARHAACTGTVVARDVILTAAHCVAGNKQLAVAYPENGSHVLQRIAAKAVSPQFSPNARVSVDLALVKLEGALPPRFIPLSLDSGEADHTIGASRVIAGFGLAAEKDEASAGVLRSARVSVLPRLYPRYLRLGHSPNATLSEFAVCTGDSGGPVLDRQNVVGVVYGREKFGGAESCGTTVQAVRIAPQRGWIDGVLTRWGRHAAVGD